MYHTTTEAMPDFTQPDFFETFGVLARDSYNCAGAYMYTLTASMMGLNCTFFRSQATTGRITPVFPEVYHKPEFYSIGWGKNHINFWSSASGISLPMQAAINTKDKLSIKKILASANISTPLGGVATSENTEVFQHLRNQGVERVIVKPISGSLSKGILADVSLEIARAHVAFHNTQTYLVEEYIIGTEIRCHTVNYKTVTAYLRDKLHIKGDGKKNISELLYELRTLQLCNPFTASSAIDVHAGLEFLSTINIYGTFVPQHNERIIISPSKFWDHRSAVNISNHITSKLKQNLKNVSKALNLKIAAIDAIISRDDTLYVLEVNTKPGGLIWGFPLFGEWNLDFPEAVIRWHFPKWRSDIRRVKKYAFLDLFSDYQNQKERAVFDVADYIEYE